MTDKLLGVVAFLFWLALAAFFIGGCIGWALHDKNMRLCMGPLVPAYVESGNDVETARYLARQECNQLHNDGLLP